MPSYLIDFYDLMTFYTNILLITTLTAVNLNMSLVLITVILFDKHIAWYSILIRSILDIFRHYIQYSIIFFLFKQFLSDHSVPNATQYKENIHALKHKIHLHVM
jgi:hypothetical protein